MANPVPPARPRRLPRPRALAAGTITAAGALAVATGVTILGGWPALLVAIGVGLLAVGLAGIDVDGK